MDPISAIVGTIAAVTSLTKTIRTIIGYVKELIDGPNFVEELSFDVEHFNHVLEYFQDFMQDEPIAHRVSYSHIKRVLDRSRQTIDALQANLKTVIKGDWTWDTIEELESGLGTDLKIEEPAFQINRLKWLQTEQKCRALRMQLASHGEKLNELMNIGKAEYMRLLFNQCQRDPQLIRSWTAPLDVGGRERRLIGLGASTAEQDLSRVSSSPILNDRSSRNASISSSGLGSDAATLVVSEEETEQTLIPVKSPESSDVQDIPSKTCKCRCHSPRTSQSNGHGSTFDIPFSTFQKPRCSNFECCVRDTRSRQKPCFTSRQLQKIVGLSVVSRSSRINRSVTVSRKIAETDEASRFAKTGNLEGLRRLIEGGLAFPSDVTPDGWTYLMSAAYQGQLDVVKYLINLKGDFDVTEDGKRTAADLARVRALMITSSEHQHRIANEFPNAEDFKDDAGLTPIHVALLGLYQHGDKERPSLSTLLRFVEDADNEPAGTNWKRWKPETRKRSSLFGQIIDEYRAFAKEHGPTQQADPKLINKPDEKWGWTPFMWATYTGRRREMEELINAGADPFTLSPMQRNALHLAAESKHADVLAYVLEIPDYNGEWFDVNLEDYWHETPLHVAASRSAECVRLLLTKGADPAARQENQQVPLHYASLVADGEEKHKIVTLLCDAAERPVNAQDEENRTPVFELLENPDCVQLLISRGADLTVVDKKGKTVLHHACIEDATESLKILLQSTPKVLHTRPYLNENTPISDAFRHKSASCAKLLIEEDAIGDFDGRDGWRLVHHAANWGNAEVLEAALKHPSYRRGLKTSRGQSAADVAKAAGTWKSGMAKELLLEYDSKGRRAAGPEPPPAFKKEA